MYSYVIIYVVGNGPQALLNMRSPVARFLLHNQTKHKGSVQAFHTPYELVELLVVYHNKMIFDDPDR